MNLLIFIIIQIFKLDRNFTKTNINLEANGRLKIKYLCKIYINCAVIDKTMTVKFVVNNKNVNPLLGKKNVRSWGNK